MRPSESSAGALPPAIIEFPEATRADQLARWDVAREYVGGALEAPVPEQAEDWLAAGGWTMAHVKCAEDFGMGTHRGVLHPDEYVDAGALAGLVEDRLGFSVGQVLGVYRQGRKSAAQLELRGRIDARLLAVREAGGNMVELARVLGFRVRENGTSKVLDGALARARKAAA